MQINDFQTLFQRIEYLRNNGIKMKEIADWIEMSPSVLSSLYTTVLPHYFDQVKKSDPDEALENAIALVNNVSKKRLLSNMENILKRLEELEPSRENSFKGNPFAEQLIEEMRLSARKIDNFKGIYNSYSLSSSTDCLKIEPFLIRTSDNNDTVRIGRLSAYGESQWGFGIMGDSQNFYCLFSENQVPLITLVTVYLQIPLFKNPRQLRGLYIGLDYNRNPVARRILLVKESESTDIDEFINQKSGLIDKEDFTPEQQTYYDYTCQTGDFIKMCTVPSLRMDESDLIKEKKMLTL